MKKYRTVTRPGIVAAALCLGTVAQAAPFTWNAGSGNWSDAGNWVEGVPSTDGTGDVVMTQSVGGALGSTIDAAWAPSGLVNTVTFTGPNRLDLNASAGTILNLASGIAWNSATNAGQMNAPVNFVNTTGFVDVTNISNIVWNASITATTSTQIEKTGAGEWRFNAGTTGPNVGFKLTQGAIRFFKDTQYDRLGTVGLTAPDANNVTLGFSSSTTNEGDVVRSFNTPVTLNGTFTATRFSLNPSTTIQTGNTSFRLNIDASWSSTSDLTGVANGGSIWLSGANDSRSKTWFNADSSGLTSTAVLTPVGGRSAVFIRGGYFVLNNANAMGVGNNLDILLGEANLTGGFNGALLATSGNHVSGDLGIKVGGGNSTTGVPLTEFIGLEGAGGVNYTGSIFLASSANVYAAPTLALTAPTGGTATFTGAIQDKGTGTFKSLVNVVGGGKIVLTNTNDYVSTTTVSQNSTLAVNGSLTNSNVVVNAGSTLQGSGSVVNAVTVAGSLAPGNSIGTLSVGSAIVTGSMDVELASASASDLLLVTGDLDISAATLNLINFGGAFDGSTYIIAGYGSLTGTQFAAVNGLTNGYTVDYDYLGGSQIALVVPEPATLGLLAVGGLMVTLRGRRRQ